MIREEPGQEPLDAALKDAHAEISHGHPSETSQEERLIEAVNLQ